MVTMSDWPADRDSRPGRLARARRRINARPADLDRGPRPLRERRRDVDDGPCRIISQSSPRNVLRRSTNLVRLCLRVWFIDQLTNVAIRIVSTFPSQVFAQGVQLDQLLYYPFAAE